MELFDALLPINLLAMAYLLLFTAGRRSDRLPSSMMTPSAGVTGQTGCAVAESPLVAREDRRAEIGSDLDGLLPKSSRPSWGGTI